MSAQQIAFRLPRRVVPADSTVSSHLFTRVLFDDFANLQRRLVYEAGSRDDGAISILLCEHEPLITLGRQGLREHIQYNADELERRGLELEFVHRGGGCVLHGPGQLAINIVAPLGRLQWSVGNYLRRLQTGIAQTLQALNVTVVTRPNHFGVWGQSGLLASFGVAVRHGIASYGAYLNVTSDPREFAAIRTMAEDSSPQMGSLLSEIPAAGKMETVRASLLEHLAFAFESMNTTVHAGHPLLPVDPHHRP